MLDRLFGRHSAKIRIAIGLVSIVVSLTLVAILIGIFPNVDNVERQGRQALAESIAANGSLFLTQKDINRLEATLALIVERNPSLLSAAIRRGDERLIAEIGDHQSQWLLQDDVQSVLTQIIVPLWSAKAKWGQVELRFAPIRAAGVLGFLQSPSVQFLLLLTLTCFICFVLYLGRMLKQLDPSAAVPDRVRSALDTMAESLLVIDRKENIVLANQAFSAMLQQPTDAIVGQKVTAYSWRDEDNAELTDLVPWQQAISSGQVVMNQLLRLSLPSHGMRSFMVNSSPILLPSGQVGGVMISLDDVTELEEKELELRRARDDAEEANRAKSEFLANMSHEIRTPMNAILGFAELMRRDKRQLTNNQVEHLNIISNSGQHLLDLINDILDLSKVESGRLELESLDCQPAQLAHQVVQIMKVKANEKQLALKLELETALPERMQTDAGKIKQILTNLIGNAVKFTERGSVTVALSVPNRSLPELHIAVTDTGIGMSQAQCESVFEAFVQADSSITRRFGGTGLGLSISQKFAQALGGRIEVTSLQGQGTTFTLVLELDVTADTQWIAPEQQQLQEQAQSTDAAEQWQFNGERILVVDDGHENRELIQLVLQDLGLEIVTAVHGKDGLDKVSMHQFDAILMDVQMPIMDGYTAVAKMRQIGLVQPIVALTAHAMKGIEQRCYDAGYSHYMTKPINIDGLIALLAELLGGQRREIDQTANLSDPGLSQPQVSSAPSEPFTDDNSAAQSRSEAADAAATQPLVSTLPIQNPRFHALVSQFVERLVMKLAEMEVAAATEQFEPLADLAHWLKGSGGSVGLMDFTEVAKELEQAAKQRQSAAIAPLLKQINELLTRAQLGLNIGSTAADETADKSETMGSVETHPL